MADAKRNQKPLEKTNGTSIQDATEVSRGLRRCLLKVRFLATILAMSEEKKQKLSTDSYKGVRDFYPADMAIQNYIFGVIKKVVESYGYLEYSASILESADLYKAKTGEEIVNEQTYTFTDRGGREVTLRPEMTPTVARMVAKNQKALLFPLRWYSIPNLFRYEQPQRGRLREHWQLNADIFGEKSLHAEVEIISLASSIMRAFGVKDNQFEIRINSRKIINYIFGELFAFPEETRSELAKLIDKKEKMGAAVFKAALKTAAGEKTDKLLTLLNSKNFEEFAKSLGETAGEKAGMDEIKTVIASLEKLGITNVVFDQTLMRGFDYYTGVVFEIFDQNPDNRRSLFGGGRYDDLLEIFGKEKVPAVGFGMGDVTIRDVLETYSLLPSPTSKIKLALCTIDENGIGYAEEVAQELRAQDISVIVNYSDKKVGDQIKSVVRQSIPYVICIGSDEIKSGKLKLKELASGKETELESSNVAMHIKNQK